jgi:hypothetical protein
MIRIAAFLLVIGATLAAPAAHAQSGGYIFNDAPPRPPADVPSSPFPAQPPPVQYPGQSPSQQQYPAQQYPAPQPYQPAPTPVARGPSDIQAQPLPAPPGATLAPMPPTNQGTATPPLPPQGAPQPMPALAHPPPPQPADTSPQPDDTVVTETPTEKIDNGRAVFAGLDKITGRTISFDAAIGETVQFGALQVTAKACYTRPPTEPTNTDAFVEVDEVTLQGEIKRIFTGWMFASSPGLHAVEHPVYDVWLTDCEQPLNGAVAQAPVQPTPGAASASPAQAHQHQTPTKPSAAPKPAAPAAAPQTDD